MAFEQNNRDVWGKIDIAGRIISSIIVAIIGICITDSYNNRTIDMKKSEESQLKESQARELERNKQSLHLQRIETLNKLIPLLKGDSRDVRGAAVFLEYADDPILTYKLSQAYGNNSNGVAFSNALSQQIVHQSVASKYDVAPSKIKSVEKKSGWVYIGQYNKEAGWVTKYLNVESYSPSSLIGKYLPVRPQTGALYLRNSMVSDEGDFGSVTGVINVGTSLCILDVRQWLDSGYQWARVSTEKCA
jgi:hypothetical protein